MFDIFSFSDFKEIELIFLIQRFLQVFILQIVNGKQRIVLSIKNLIISK